MMIKYNDKSCICIILDQMYFYKRKDIFFLYKTLKLRGVSPFYLLEHMCLLFQKNTSKLLLVFSVWPVMDWQPVLTVLRLILMTAGIDCRLCATLNRTKENEGIIKPLKCWLMFSVLISDQKYRKASTDLWRHEILFHEGDSWDKIKDCRNYFRHRRQAFCPP